MPTFVQDYANATSNAANSILTSGLTFTTGNTLIVFAAVGSGVAQACSDTLSNTYTAVGVVGGAGANALAAWYSSNIIGGADTITVSNTSNCNWIYVAEINGLGAFLTSSSNSQSSPGTVADAVTSGTMTISQAALIFGFCRDVSGGSTLANAGTGFTGRTQHWSDATPKATPEYKSVSANAACTFTATGSFDTYLTWGVAFSTLVLPPAGGGIFVIP